MVCAWYNKVLWPPILNKTAIVALARRGALNEERWEEILIAAAQVFDERGYQATTLKDVASRVGLQTGSLY